MRGRSMRSWGVLLLFATVAGVVAVSAVGSAGAAASVAGSNWKFAPTINAPWAQGSDDNALDVPAPTAVGLCRSSLFNTANPYAPTSNVDAINGDVVNNSGVSNNGCIAPQNETTVAVNPTNSQNVVAGTNDYRK